MPLFNYQTALCDSTLLDIFDAGTLDFVGIKKGKTAIYTDGNGAKIKIFGTDFVSSDGLTFTGTITGVSFLDALGNPLMDVSLLSKPADTLSGLLFNLDLSSFLDTISNLRDKIIGTSGNDIFLNGANAGRDVIMGGGGADIMFGSHGNDKMDGGDGVDLLSFGNTYGNTTAFTGIVVNTAKGLVRDAWNMDDTISGFEHYYGSKFEDEFIGSARGETFAGLGGADRINGRGGLDTLDYSQDALFSGGGSGITIDFNFINAGPNIGWSSATDGFGNTDYFKNVERVIGTNSADTIVGDGRYRIFSGLDGIDNISGGWYYNPNGGIGSYNDTVDFSGDFAEEGVIANLKTGVIANDGFGNAENYTGIAHIIGSKFADDLTAANSYGDVNGSAGDDIIRSSSPFAGDYTGGSGADTFIFTPGTTSLSSYHSHEILDYNRGENDVIRFEGYGAVSFVSNGSFTGTGPEFTLYFASGLTSCYIDYDGNGAADRIVRVYTAGLNAGDFIFV